MNPNELIEKLTQYQDVETATAIWAQANRMAKEFDQVKKMCTAFVEKHLRETGESKGKTQTCSYGWTNPKPKMKLNKDAWEKAVLENMELQEIEASFAWKKRRLEQAQKPYIEEYTPNPRVYIK